MLNEVQLPDFVIPNGGTTSNIMSAPEYYGSAECVALYAPAALEALTYTIEVNADPLAVTASAGWVTLQIGDPAGDAAPPAAGKARLYYELPAFAACRIKCSGAAVGSKTWKATKSEYAG